MKRTLQIWLLFLCMCFVAMVIGSSRGAFAQATYEIEEDLAVDEAEGTEQNLVSLDFKDANLKDVLKVFSQQSGLNFVATQEVQERPVTLYMENVKVEDALQTLLSSNNLGLTQTEGSNIIIVKSKPTPPIETRTKVYKLRYFHGNVSPGQYLMKGEPAKDGGIGNIREIIQPLLSKFGSIAGVANLVIITDVPDRFKLIDQIIGEIDRPIPEVMLEVELIETTSSFLKQVGVKWSGEFARYVGGSRVSRFPYNLWGDGLIPDRTHMGHGSPITVSSTAGGVDTTVGGGFTYGLMSSAGLTWVLQMLESDTNTKFLAKPRILCQDREWAEIKVTADQVVSVKSTITTGTTTTITTEVERMEVGTILRMVPLINEEEGFVSILLEPSVSRPTESSISGPNGEVYIDPQYRSMRTTVMIRDGDTVAVGGFITTEDEETVTKVPWLGDIPLLGLLFKHRAMDRVDKELLIFITPKIISPTERMDMWVESVSEPQVAKEDKADKEQAEPEPGSPIKKIESMMIEKNDAPSKNKPAASAPVKELPFREQDDLKLDLTLQSSGLGVVDLVK
ncbi:MAG: hypothetical protein ABII88_07250 [Candidatus Omnitrophota bacterium]